jgi:hypothetical protein
VLKRLGIAIVVLTVGLLVAGFIELAVFGETYRVRARRCRRRLR